MDGEYVSGFIGCVCKIDLENGFYYKGKILSVGDDSLVLIDMNGKRVILALSVIVGIREVEG